MTTSPPPTPLRKLFQRMALTLVQVSQATGCPVTSLSAMQADARPLSRQLLAKLRDAGVDVDRLLADTASYRVERMRAESARLAELAAREAQAQDTLALAVASR